MSKKYIKIEVAELPGRYMYTGKLEELQLYGSNFDGKRYSVDKLNSYQSFLYNRALFGLSVYSQEEIKQMHSDKKKRILKVSKRAQLVLNVWKQEIVNARVSNLFTKLFPKSDITGVMVEECKHTDPKFVNKMSFKSLGITKEMVIFKLMREGILPKDFFELKHEVCT